MSIKAKTPVADRLLDIKKELRGSFHALPIFNSNFKSHSNLIDKYLDLIGETYARTEITVAGSLFDSFFFPQAAIKESEDLAAKLYGADGTLYVTCGTSIANRIALASLYENGAKVLLDKNCHQSMHFTLRSLGADISYIVSETICSKSERCKWSLPHVIRQITDLQNENSGYDLIVLNAQSYDGVIYDVPKIIEAILESGATTRKFMIDEAWGSANYFNTSVKDCMAMKCRVLMDRYPDLKVVATHSAHKSLNCLRQASMIHFLGDLGFRPTLNASRFQYHTTSPSYPILASLDLGRAQMEEVGVELMDNCVRLAEEFTSHILQDPALDEYKINILASDRLPEYVVIDPTKISLDVGSFGMPAGRLVQKIYEMSGIYISRYTETALLLNFHIGITKEIIENLTTCLVNIQKQLGKQVKSWASKTSQQFIIPYPPGVPLVVPGEAITQEVVNKIQLLKKMELSCFLPRKGTHRDYLGKDISVFKDSSI